jgi:hypothetical protein
MTKKMNMRTIKNKRLLNRPKRQKSTSLQNIIGNLKAFQTILFTIALIAVSYQLYNFSIAYHLTHVALDDLKETVENEKVRQALEINKISAKIEDLNKANLYVRNDSLSTTRNAAFTESIMQVVNQVVCTVVVLGILSFIKQP